MLTSIQRRKCAEIAASLDAGDTDSYRRAEASLTPEAKGLIWDMRRGVVAVGQRKQVEEQQHQASNTSLKSHDLDYWSDDPADDPDDDEEQETRLCPSCGGKGCERCDGSGRLPMDDFGDEE
jgi:hypothetical protein